jgi:hypothetical protein
MGLKIAVLLRSLQANDYYNWVLALFLAVAGCRIIDETKAKYADSKTRNFEMSYIIWSRSCKKCKGQFYLEDSEDGHYLTCIQCGYSEKIVDEELVTLMKAIQPPNKKESQKVTINNLNRKSVPA